MRIAKKGKMCVRTQEQSYTDYSASEKTIELRAEQLPPGARVVVVDQWIETGGTMTGAVELLERAGAVTPGDPRRPVQNSAIEGR